MFWNRRNKSELKDSPSLQSLATQLGVERRFAVRVRYPSSSQVCKLPEIYFQSDKLKIADISVGGCCVLDPDGFMGPAIGHDIELNLHWSTVIETVKARIVSRVDHRRHIQFLDISSRRQAQLTKSMAYGVRGTSMTRHAHSSDLGPTMDAAELWSSPHMDSVVVENDVHRIAQVYLNGEQFMIFREAWPNKLPGGKCSKPEFEQVILFIANIPLPSPPLKGLLKYLEGLLNMGAE
ncbi:MAG: PilZ domain-containing protein [Bdellovibrionales bacterium]